MTHEPTRIASLDEQLGGLAREVEPTRDLWPAVAAAIQPKARRRWPLAVAAGLVAATLAGVAGWQAGRYLGPAPAMSAASGMGLQGATDPALPQGHGYLAARAVLERTYAERLPFLDVKTRLRIEHDLATIHAANADIRRALAADPQSPVLNRLLEGIWQQEFDLYVTVARNTQSATQESGT
jgi:hypothetical protein